MRCELNNERASTEQSIADNVIGILVEVASVEQVAARGTRFIRESFQSGMDGTAEIPLFNESKICPSPAVVG